MGIYIFKPPEFEAVEFKGDKTAPEIVEFLGGEAQRAVISDGDMEGAFIFSTPFVGGEQLYTGDYLVKDTQKFISVWSADRFHRNFQPVEPPVEPAETEG